MVIHMIRKWIVCNLNYEINKVYFLHINIDIVLYRLNGFKYAYLTLMIQFNDITWLHTVKWFQVQITWIVLFAHS